MFGLPPAIIQLIVLILQKTGAVNWAEALIAKGVISATQHIETLKSYSQYPSQDTKGQPNLNQ